MTRLAVIVASGIAAWLSCNDAEVRMALIGISPSATSRCSLYPIQLVVWPLALRLVPTVQCFGKSASIAARLMLVWRSRRRGSFVSTTFARLDCSGIARDVADQAILIGLLDQRLVEAAWQRTACKLGKSAREGGFAGKLSPVLPAAQPAQWAIHRKRAD